MSEGRQRLNYSERLLVQIADLRVKLEDILAQDLPGSHRRLLLRYVRTRLVQLIASLKDARRKTEASRAF